MVLLFLGPTGSGKDTQAEILAKEYGYTYISSGDLFRQEIKLGTELGKKLNGYMSKGKLVPDKLVYQILGSRIEREDHKNLIFTGVVRKKEQMEMFDKALASKNLKLDKVVLFELSDDEVLKRLSNRWYCPTDGATYHMIYNPPKEDMVCDNDGTRLERRDDDKPENIKVRLKEQFHDTYPPIIEAYNKQGLLLTVDAAPSIEEIAKVLKKELKLD